MTDKEKIESIIRDTGLTDYRWMDPREVVVAHWVRVKCMFGCEDYGYGTCPPNTPPVDECRQFFREYSTGLVFRVTTFADKDDYPVKWSRQMTDSLLEIERRIFLMGHEKTFLLNQTCCAVCKDCPGNMIECTDKKRARPSPESFAVDVYTTVKKFGYDLRVVSENPSEINRFAFILIE